MDEQLRLCLLAGSNTAYQPADHYIEQANFVKGVLDLEQVEFKLMDIDSVDESTVGLFDITFCFGILYHLENPILTMRDFPQ